MEFVIRLFKTVDSRLKKYTSLPKVLSSIGWLTADNFIRLFVGLFVNTWLFRYFGPETMGIWGYAGAFIAIFFPLAALGMDVVVIRAIVRKPEDRNKILGTAFLLRFCAGCLFAVIALTVLHFFDTADPFIKLVITIMLVSMVLQAFEVIDLYFKSQVVPKFSIWAKDAVLLIFALVKIVLILMKASLLVFVWAGLAEAVLSYVGLVIIFKRQGFSFKQWEVDLSVAVKLLKESWPVFLSSFCVMALMRLDQIFIANMLGVREVGIFNASLRLIEACYFIPMTIGFSVNPIFIAQRQTTPDLYYRHLQKLFSVMVIVALPIAVSLSLGSGFIINMLYGQSFASAAVILSLYAWVLIFVFLSVATEAWSIAEDKLHLTLIRNFFALIINVSLNIFLIPRWGIIAPAFAMLCSQIFVSYLFDLFCPVMRPLFFMKTKAFLFEGIFVKEGVGR